MSFTYDQIKPLIVSADVDGSSVICEFALPGSQKVHQASAYVRRTRSAGSQVSRQVKRTLANEARRTISGLLRGIFGGGIVGRTARTAVNTASRSTVSNIANAPSREDKEQAIVDAFGKVSKFFQWNDSSQSWEEPGMPPAPVEPTPFQEQLDAHPVTSKFEKDVLARILARVAYSDGSLADEEKDFFEQSIPSEIGTLGELAQAEPVSTVEAEEISVGVRETIYMLAWTISLIDMDMDEREEELLYQIGENFGFDRNRSVEISNLARVYVLESYLYPEISRDEVYEFGTKLGLSNDDAERAKIRWMKRQ